MSKPIRPNIKGVFPLLPNGLHEVALGNGTQYTVSIVRTSNGFAIGIVGKGCYVFGNGAHSPGYICEKMKIEHHNMGDAANFSDMITSQFMTDREYGSFTPIGKYGSYFCANE